MAPTAPIPATPLTSNSVSAPASLPQPAENNISLGPNAVRNIRVGFVVDRSGSASGQSSEMTVGYDQASRLALVKLMKNGGESGLELKQGANVISIGPLGKNTMQREVTIRSGQDSMKVYLNNITGDLSPQEGSPRLLPITEHNKFNKFFSGIRDTVISGAENDSKQKSGVTREAQLPNIPVSGSNSNEWAQIAKGVAKNGTRTQGGIEISSELLPQAASAGKSGDNPSYKVTVQPKEQGDQAVTAVTFEITSKGVVDSVSGSLERLNGLIANYNKAIGSSTSPAPSKPASPSTEIFSEETFYLDISGILNWANTNRNRDPVKMNNGLTIKSSNSGTILSGAGPARRPIPLDEAGQKQRGYLLVTNSLGQQMELEFSAGKVAAIKYSGQEAVIKNPEVEDLRKVQAFLSGAANSPQTPK